MDALARDYPTLLAEREPPCLSLYQPTHRTNPDRQQDRIRFRNLVRELEASLQQKYPKREIAPLLAPFHDLAEDTEFWNHAQDGLAVFGAPGLFKVYRLQRSVRELAIVAESFHTKPLMRIMQSGDRYHVLGIGRREMRLFEGDRYTLEEIEPAAGVPRTAGEVVGDQDTGPERSNRVYGSAGSQVTTSHGMDLRRAEMDNEADRFFRAVDAAVLTHHSQPTGKPLLLAALAEHHHRFRSISRNPHLLDEAIDVDVDAVPADELRARAWRIILPRYLARLDGLVERFGTAQARQAGSVDLADIAREAVNGRIETLLVEADREIPGRFDNATGAIEFAPLEAPGVDDLLDDIGEHVLRTGGEVVIVPAESMPSDTGLAAIYRH
ncbi:baeRF3 domain-containing protein [Pontibaca methylaminivorans]|uniref:baeRF3 domain-containing protein n=1 Tax=Pontibaca methylaminivorans TaxID=515897 RepID=UPI002FDAB83D